MWVFADLHIPLWQLTKYLWIWENVMDMFHKFLIFEKPNKQSVNQEIKKKNKNKQADELIVKIIVCWALF